MNARPLVPHRGAAAGMASIATALRQLADDEGAHEHMRRHLARAHPWQNPTDLFAAAERVVVTASRRGELADYIAGDPTLVL